MNFKKKMSVALAATVCCSVISTFGAAASAEEYTYSETDSIVSELYAADPAYTEAVKLAGLKFNSGLAKKVKSFSGKSSKTKVTFSKSKTKKYFDDLNDTLQKMRKNTSAASISIAMVSEDEVTCMAKKGFNTKTIVWSKEDNPIGYALYTDRENITLLYLSTKQMIIGPNSSDGVYNDTIYSFTSGSDDLDIKDSSKGKNFKFKYNNKIYYYEEYEKEDGDFIGCVFDTKLNLVMIRTAKYTYSVKISTSVKSSEMTVPDGYEDIS